MVYKRYRTRLLCHPDTSRRPRVLFYGKCWRASLEPQPVLTRHSNHSPTPYEIVLLAPSLERAKYAAELLLAADSVIMGAYSFFGQEITVMPEAPPDDPADLEAHRRFMDKLQGNASELESAIEVAARASHRRRYQYALFKLRLSYSLCSVHPMDLEPSHWWSQRAVWNHAGHHVSLAYAIQAAYSAIEELGLEVRATTELPSMKSGRWNPPVLKDLQDRLRAAGVDLSESIPWTRRGTPTKVERQFPLESISKASWAHRSIRDVYVPVEDAIRNASSLRSKVAAHRLRGIAGSPTHYDASNVQLLARRLLLESLGCRRTLADGDA